MNHDCLVYFEPSCCYVQDRHTELIGWGYKRGIYYMDHLHMPSSSYCTPRVGAAISPSGDLWHRQKENFSWDRHFLLV